VVRVVTPEYFDTLGIPLHSGRWFTARDAAATPRVLIVNEALARRYWQGENPVGRRITLVFTKVPYEIIGVVGNTPAERLDEDAKPAIYFAFDQFPTPLMSLLVRSPRDPADVASLLRAATREIDRDVALYRIFTMDSVVSDSVWQSRFSMLLLSGLAGLAVVLASVGLYGVLRYTVAQRAHEIGIRVALGASRSDVLRLVIGGAMRPALAGIAMGLLAALALTQLMSGLLYGVTARDAKTFVAAPVLLITLALTAAWFPARKAAAADPMGALRAE
jgi:putative ABC transport system permease protein